MPMGRNACNQTLTTVQCNTTTTDSNLIQMGSASNSSLAVWNVSSLAAPAPVTQILANGNYYLQSVGRQTCDNYTSAVAACGGSKDIAMSNFSGNGLQVWTFTSLGNNLYDVASSARAQCYNYMSTPTCGGNFVDQWYQVQTSTNLKHFLNHVPKKFVFKECQNAAISCPSIDYEILMRTGENRIVLCVREEMESEHKRRLRCIV